MLRKCLNLFGRAHQLEGMFGKFNVFPNRGNMSFGAGMAKLKPYLQRTEAAGILKTTFVEICLLLFFIFKNIFFERRYIHFLIRIYGDPPNSLETETKKVSRFVDPRVCFCRSIDPPFPFLPV